MESLHKIMSALRAKICACNERRNENTLRFTMTNRMLLLLFPIFIVCMAELNQDKYLSKLVIFIADHPTIMLFNILIAGLIFLGALLLFRKGWLAMLLQSVLYMALSITELFKYNTNGNHLIMTDMKLFRSVKSLTSFAYIKITPRLLIFIGIVLAYIIVAFWFHPKFSLHTKRLRRMITGLSCLLACALVILVPTLSTPVYAFFGVDVSKADNTFILNEKFENNGFLAFFMQTGSENIANRLEEPVAYEENKDSTVAQYLDEVTDQTNFKDGVKPNVIEIMSESYADFRVFDELDIPDDVYAGLDEVAAKGVSGTAIAPTYASYTVRTEFELLFGLPVKSLNDPNMPQRMLLERQQPTIPSYYKAQGYSTAYVHPFQGSFYNRRSIYSRFSFDTMIFEDDFTVPVDLYGTYIDDNTVYNQIEQLITDTDEPLYLHATTMQNHQPYNQGTGATEFDNYLQWVKHSSDGLADFIDRLSKLDEPTIVLFIGDHFPSLRGEDGIYAQLGITSENCSTLYEQKYVMWNNFGLDMTKVQPQEEVSVFYLPYVMMQEVGMPKDSFTQSMMDEMPVTPIYSTNYAPGQERNEKLDTLTYDRILGDMLSPDAVEEEAPDSSTNTDTE